MKANLLIVLFLISFLNLFCQSVEWVIPFGGELDEASSNITVDGKGNTYMVGYFSTVLDLTPDISGDELTAQSTIDIFLCKISPDGVVQWIVRVDNYIDQGSVDIAITHDKSGNIILEYFFLTEDGFNDVRIKKFSPSGNQLWQNDFAWFGSVDINQPSAIEEEIIVVNVGCDDEYYEDPVTFINANGDCLVTQSINEDSDGFITWEIYEQKKDTIYFIGDLYGTVTLNWTNSNITIGEGRFPENYRRSTILAKVLKTGEMLSINIINEGSDDQVSGFVNGSFPVYVRLDSKNNIYVLSVNRGRVTYGVGDRATLVNTGINSDGVLAKYSSTGDLLWIERWESPSNAFFYDMDIDNNDNLVFGSAIFGIFDVDPKESQTIFEPITIGQNNLLVFTLDGDANFLWAKEFGFSVGKIDIDADNNLIVDGRFTNDVSLDIQGSNINISNDGFDDGYVMKINTESIVGTHNLNSNQEEISIFPSPANDYISIEPTGKIHQVQVLNLNGTLITSYDPNDFDSLFSLSVSYLTSGSYILRFLTDDGVQSILLPIVK
ncbi:MAG: T9SS type A sorting domain-containing protein [Bacteroidota bacterium]